MAVLESPTLAVDRQVRARLATGERVLHLAFGEAGLPVLPEAAAALAGGAQINSYGPVEGSSDARAGLAGNWNRRDLPTSSDSVILAPESKAILYALLQVIPGDVLLPKPSWVSYGAQAAIAGRRAIWVSNPASVARIPDPNSLMPRSPRLSPMVGEQGA
ncbi:MAG: aminotransferase class I/II-fold pyridoxal phosphate-dependent enzyme [Candidatus Dormiibacterota bacterium]